MRTVRTSAEPLKIAALALLVTVGASAAELDLLKAGADAWQAPDPSRWVFDAGEIRGKTPLLDGAKTDPEASAFLVSKKTFGGDIVVSIDVTFDEGRYLGVYLHYGQETQSGIWMATGHPLADDPDERPFEIETAYIKTVDDSVWVVRTRGELLFEPGERVRLKFVKKGDDYSVWHDERLVVTYRRAGYAPGPLQLRLTNAAARIHRVAVTATTVTD